METNKQKEGISLIVLVITIIVMIILAAAIILSLQSSGIIGRANEAKAEADKANKKQAASVALTEYELAKQIGETTKTATEYVQDKLNSQKLDGSDVAVTEDGEVLVGLKKSAISAVEKGVKLGDYVSYTPTVATSTKYKACAADAEGEGEAIEDETNSTAFSTQIGENALKWKYMGIDEEGNVILISDIPTTDRFYIGAGSGYLNGPSRLDDLCKELYSNANLGQARSIDVEDVNRVLGANPIGQYYSKTEDKSVENKEGLTIKEIAEKQKIDGFKPEYVHTPDGTNTWDKISSYVSDWYNYSGKTFKDENTVEYELIFNNVEIVNGVTKKTNLRYWLASNCVYGQFLYGYASFFERRVIDGNVNTLCVFYSGGSSVCGRYAVRPVIVLNSDVQFGTKSESGVWSIN